MHNKTTLYNRLQRILLTLLIASGISLASYAQDDSGAHLDQFYVETRASFDRQSYDGDITSSSSGFKGKYLNFRIDGQIAKGLTFSYRQRMNKVATASFFDATDWIHLDWAPTDCLSLSAGKQVVAIGGYEYDRAPIDLYTCSEFWHNIACYQFGMSAMYKVAPGNSLLFQICNSPYRLLTGTDSYAFNLMWYGKLVAWETMYSTNMIQTNDDWITYIALGNRFRFTDAVRLDLDLMSRASKASEVTKDFSVMAEISYQPSEPIRCFAKYTYDQNKSGSSADLLVLDGTQMNTVSAGVEWSPVRAHRDALRLYANGGYSFGDNANPDGQLRDRTLMLETGLKVRLDILEGLSHICHSK